MPPPLLDVLYIFAGLVYLPFLCYQMLVLKKNRRGWAERFGAGPTPTGDGPRVWIHAVSLGEVNATKSLVEVIKRRRPDCQVVISATTDTGIAAARRHYPDLIVFRYPLDFSWVVRRVLNRIRPAAIILMELEVWPNFIKMGSDRGVAVCIANGRVTEEKSMRRFRKPVIREIARSMFSRISWTAAQDNVYAERFVELGVAKDRVQVVGNLKYDTADLSDHIPGSQELAAAMGIDPAKPLVVAGSTGPGEEELVLAAYLKLRNKIPGLQLAIIPRKPERFDEVAGLIASRSCNCRRRSALTKGNNPGPLDERPTVFLGDTMGELRKFYDLATVVYVGRTLVPLGGSDPIEVAALARPMCYGPYMENFADAERQLRTADAAVRISNAADLPAALEGLLTKRDEAAEMGRRARRVVESNKGATDKTIDLLLGCLPRDAS